jgi:hypothetical protein
MRDEVMRGPVDALDVDRVDAIELGFGDFQDRLVAMGGAGVVDHAVDVAERGQRRIAHRGHVIALRHVGTHRARLASCLADGRRYTLGGFQVQVGHHHAGAFARERVRDALAKARTTTRDYRYLSRQSGHRLSPVIVVRTRCMPRLVTVQLWMLSGRGLYPAMHCRPS